MLNQVQLYDYQSGTSVKEEDALSQAQLRTPETLSSSRPS